MAALSGGSPAILVLADGSLAAARRVREALPGAVIHRQSGQVTCADSVFADFGETLRQLFRDDVPIVVFCAAEIVIRALAPLLVDERAEPPVLAVAEDGSAVVPLLGGRRGIDALTRVGEALGIVPAISVTEEIRSPGLADPLSLAIIRSPITATTSSSTRGRLTVVGLGPGADGSMTPDARTALSAAEDIVGYAAYLRMAGPFRPDQSIHASDNREETSRARVALSLAASGRSVAIVSSGDPGIFAMASAVMEALHGSEDPAWHGVELVVIPGVSAAQAAAARAGAPLGHDFCVLSLSDNLKPWAVIERRLALAAAADFVLALYNPVSRTRPWQFGRAVEIVRGHRAPDTPVVLGRNLGRPGESTRVVSLAELAPSDADMRTVVIIGSSTTQAFPRGDGGVWVYTPRRYGDPAPAVSEPAVTAARRSPR